MPTSLSEIQSVGFYTSREADEINTWLGARLGLRNRYEPARLAIARSLSFAGMPPSVDTDDAPGKVIRGEQLFGTGPDAAAWVSLIVEHAGLSDPNRKDLLDLVRRHWHRGAIQLKNDWKQSDENYDRFVLTLAERAGIQEAPARKGTELENGVVRQRMGAAPIVLRLGDVAVFAESGAPAEWTLNQDGQSPHLGVFGKPGKGKTVTAKSILRQVARHGVPIIFVDPKGEFRDDAAFAAELNASIIVLGRDPIPLDALGTEASVLRVADGFVDAVGNAVSELGPKQKDALREVCKKVLAGPMPVRMEAIVSSVSERYKQNRLKPDVLTATLNKIQDYKLFDPKFSPVDFFSRSWIISVAEVQDEALRFAMLFLLDAMLRYLRSCPDSESDRVAGVRALRVLLAVDEARRVVEVASPSLLEGLVLECRSKGLSTFFISQSPDHLERASDDIVRQFEVIASFEADLSPRMAKRVFGGAVTPETLQGLKKGTCVARLPGRSAETVRVWEPKGS